MLMLVESFLDFLKEQNISFTYEVDEGWLECDRGKISLDKLGEFLTRINEDGMIKVMRTYEKGGSNE